MLRRAQSSQRNGKNASQESTSSSGLRRDRERQSASQCGQRRGEEAIEQSYCERVTGRWLRRQIAANPRLGLEHPNGALQTHECFRAFDRDAVPDGLMKHLLNRLWLLATIGGVGCAVGSSADLADPLGPVPQRDGGASQETDATLLGADGSSGANDGAAAVKDASVVVPDAALDSATAGPCAFAGQLVSFDLTKLAGVQANLAASAKAPGVTATALARVGVTVVSSSQAMNASDWSTGGVDSSKHYVFSVSPPAGCTLSVTVLAIDLKASSTGPTMVAVGTSVDGYAALANVAVTTAGGAANVPLAGIVAVSGSVEVHVFGFNAASSSGTLRIQNTLSLSGALGPSI